MLCFHLVHSSSITELFFPQQICHNRLLKRKRPEESTVEQNYLERLHERHEEWLINKTIKLVTSIACMNVEYKCHKIFITCHGILSHEPVTHGVLIPYRNHVSIIDIIASNDSTRGEVA